MIVPAGGLDEDGIEWRSSSKNFFLPIKALSSMFRAIVCRMINEGIELKQIETPLGITSFKTLKEKLYEKNWNVYSKKSFGGVNGVLQYLGRYTHRVAISNRRIKSADSKKVDFYWKDYRNKNSIKLMRLDTTEFIRRFLMHVLPSGFYKIRYYGILAAKNSSTKKEQCISLIGKSMMLPFLEGLSGIDVFRIMTGKDTAKCPKCHEGIMKIYYGERLCDPVPT